MNLKNLSMALTASILCCLSAPSEAAFTIKDGWIVDSEEIATLPLEEHYNLGHEAMQHGDWREAAHQFRVVSVNFPTTPQGQEAFFYLGMAYYQFQEFDFANDAFSNYLKCNSNPEHFEDAILYKFDIANQFKDGAKKRPFGTKQLPKWASGHELALEIYDEVAAAVPYHELAVYSLFYKGDLLWKDRFYNDSVDIYMQLVKRFPKHELAPESYLQISKIYLEQSTYEEQNPDLLAFSEINLKRFQQAFPRDERVTEVGNNLMTMKEKYAHAIYEIGKYYERKEHLGASVIYYRNAIQQFPDTETAQRCERRLMELGAYPQPANSLSESS